MKYLFLICAALTLAHAEPSQPDALKRFGHGVTGDPVPAFPEGKFALAENEVIALIGQENLVREQKQGVLESILAVKWAAKKPRFRSMAWEADTVYEQWRDLHFGDWGQQLETAGVTMVVAQFGQMEALDGTARLPEFVAAYHRLLDQFSARTGRLVLLSPLPFEKPLASHAPDLSLRNGDVKKYAEAIRDIAIQRKAVFVDLFTPLVGQRLTEDGIHLTNAGLVQAAEILTGAVASPPLREAIVQKNRLWFDCWRPANWSFAYGDRVNQMYGKEGGGLPSLQGAFEQQLPLVEAADARIHALANGGEAPALVLPDMAAHDDQAMSPEEQMATFTLADGYAVNLFASEKDGVVNPTQFAWDERGRLYVACSPGYPQSLATMPPTDYILVLEDTDHDGHADKSWRFAEGLTMVQGVEPGAGGVYVCDFDQLLHFRDTDGDGKADERTLVFSGFGIGDTHQLINSICHGPDGSLWFSQGLHAMSRVETPWGIARLDRAAVWRMRPRELRLEGFFGGGMAGANCWGVAFDDFGQVFHKSGDRPQGYWTVPGMVRGASPIGSGSTTEASVSYGNSPEQYHTVGPLFDTSPKTTALEFIGTRALPDDIQGCALIAGYFGSVVELHRLEDAGAGFKSTQLPKLMTASNDVFRPVDVSVGPDGAMYLADWYNPVIGHYQASYADPKRDKSHGRIWRITAKGMDAVKKPDIATMESAQLLELLKSPERWTRYQAKKRLFYLPTDRVLAAADAWTSGQTDERLLMEVTGVYEAHEAARPDLLARLLAAKDSRVRAYGARVAGMWGELELLRKSVRDEHPRVRLESVVAASYVEDAKSVEVVAAALDQARDPFLDYAIRQSARALRQYWAPAFSTNGLQLGSEGQKAYFQALLGDAGRRPSAGEEVYNLACLTCHQPGGKGLAGVYPPLAGSEWTKKSNAALIRIVLHGIAGPLKVAGAEYGTVPMPPMGGLSDQQIADVLTFVREMDGQTPTAVTVEEVAAVRVATLDRTASWTAGELNEISK